MARAAHSHGNTPPLSYKPINAAVARHVTARCFQCWRTPFTRFSLQAGDKMRVWWAGLRGNAACLHWARDQWTLSGSELPERRRQNPACCHSWRKTCSRQHVWSLQCCRVEASVYQFCRVCQCSAGQIKGPWPKRITLPVKCGNGSHYQCGTVND